MEVEIRAKGKSQGDRGMSVVAANPVFMPCYAG